MTSSQLQLELDKSGSNPDNFVSNEPHTLSNRPTRAIAPNHGVFYSHGVTIRAGGKVWTSRGIDFQLVELHQEATLLYAKELYSVILIINPEIPTDVTIEYHALGGVYSVNDKAIAQMYQSVLQDNRAVGWKNILDKPSEWNPKIHRHLLDDVYGFEPIVDYLERIKRGITLGQTDVVIEIINNVLAGFRHQELPKILPNTKMMQYDAFLYFMTRRKIISNIWVEVVEASWRKGSEGTIRIDTSGYPIGTTLYWEFYSPDGNIALFPARSKAFVTTGGIMEIKIYVPAEDYAVNPNLYIGIKENLTDEEYKAVTYRITIEESYSTSSAYGYLLYANRTAEDFDNKVALIAEDDERRLWYLVHTR